MDEFLKKLYDNNQTLSMLLLEAKDIVEGSDDSELKNYIEKEIDGYRIEDDIPDYRKIKGEIVANIKNAYGELVFTEYLLDFSILSENVGMDVNDVYFLDSISFVETSIRNLTGKNGLRPLPQEMVKILDETFHYNNPQLHLTTAYHKIPTATMEYILIKVRQNLIQGFQKLNRKTQQSETFKNIQKISATPTKRVKSVFISYAWENKNHNDKVISFVNFLLENGFDASMDKKKSQEQASINFNQMMIEGIQNSDKVIIVLSEEYKRKADKFEGGVGMELKIILEDMKKNKNKYIFVSFGNQSRDEITPTAILGTNILDLKHDQDENKFNTLFSKIKEENIIEFSEVNNEEIIVKKIEIKPFKL